MIKNKKKKNNSWVYKIFITTFLLSLIFGAISNTVIINLNLGVALVILATIIAIGIFFDIIGVAVQTAAESPFHAKAAYKHEGAKEAVHIVKNASKVSSICNDVAGDICGVLSGSTGALIAIKLSEYMNMTLASLIMASIISSLTVFGKARCKDLARNNKNEIVYRLGRFLYIFKKKNSL